MVTVLMVTKDDELLMSNNDPEHDQIDDKVTWSSEQVSERTDSERRKGEDRRKASGRTITVPDMRSGIDRRSGEDRRRVRLTITGRAMNI